MQIFVRSVNSTFVVNVAVDATVADLKNAIEDVEFVPASQMRIVKENCTLEDGSLLGLVGEAETVSYLLDVVGGMRAKWRKKRMRRLRRKRRKMRQRAR